MFMVEVVYEWINEWPEKGPVQVTAPSLTIDIPISPDMARRRANGYLGLHVGLLLGTSDPRLIVDDCPHWKLAVNLHLPGLGYVGQVGVISVDATTGDVIPLSADAMQAIQDRAHDLIVHFAPAAEPAS
jgi:hypothetical protein